MSTTVKLELQIQEFEVPTHVMEVSRPPPAPVPPFLPCDEPAIGSRMFRLSELPTETLDYLCDQFRREVFRRAGQVVPPLPVKPPTPVKPRVDLPKAPLTVEYADDWTPNK